MCNVEVDIEELTLSLKNLEPLIEKNVRKCKKCAEDSVLLLQKKDPFCKTCFFEYCDHKFRSTIGKTKKIKHGAKVLLACSGGRKSSALLHMTRKALESASLKQISFVPGILFIDESIVPLNSEECTKLKVEEILEELKNYKYPILYSSLEMAHCLNTPQKFYWEMDSRDSQNNFDTCANAQSWMKSCLKNMHLSEKIDFIRHVRLLLMSEIAHSAGYEYLFLGDSACSLASNLLTNISLGRGSQISSDTNFCDTRHKVSVCRPLREFLNKEIALYNFHHNCLYRILPDLLTKTDVKSSVQRLTEAFITNLQEDFPATVFTIFRTGGKLSISDIKAQTAVCLLCKSKLDNQTPDPCSASEAFLLSEKLSESSTSHADSSSHLNSNLSEESCATESPYPKEVNIMKYLCHGCLIPFRKNTNLPNLFSPFHINHIKMKKTDMKKEINEFLINEE